LASPDFQLLIKAMFPAGTNPWSTEDTVAVPEWPPDLFAFAATVAEHHGLYAEMEFSGGWAHHAYPYQLANMD
jgi:hypothetical protein